MIDINTWWAAAQAHPYMAVTQAVGCLTIAIAMLKQLGLNKVADSLQSLENALLAGQAAYKQAFVTSLKAPKA